MEINRPAKREGFYFSRYIDLNIEDDLISALEGSRIKMIALLGSLGEMKANYAYEHDKWSIKEVLAHCIDTERILAYRALCFSRNEEKMLPGFDQETYSKEETSSRISITQLLEEYDLVRRSTIFLFKRMKGHNLDFEGLASNMTVSARELGWTIAGHDLHHMKVLEEKYLTSSRIRGSVTLTLDW